MIFFYEIPNSLKIKLKFKRNFKEISMAINFNPVEVSMKFSKNFNEIQMEVHWKSS